MLFYCVPLHFCDCVFVFQCLCFLVIVQKCALVQFSHDLPMAKWQNCRWRRMAKLAKWVKWAIRIAPILGSKHKTKQKLFQTIEIKGLFTFIKKQL